MSVREEDRQKSACTSRGLGLAAAAIGVGVGAAMYYFFSKRPERPHNEGSTSDWNCEPPETFPLMESEDSYTTVSEHDTTDTSINTTTSENVTASEESEYYSDSTESDDEDDESVDDESMDDDDHSSNFTPPTNMSFGEVMMTFDEISPNFSLGDMTLDNSITDNILGDTTFDNSITDNILGDTTFDNSSNFIILEDASYYNDSQGSDSDSNVVNDIMMPVRQALDDLKRLYNSRIGKAPNEHAKLVNLRQQSFRERSWSLEQCSICFDVMLRSQEVMSLTCTHNFHTGCILPWLQEKQTCPVCRKAVD